MPRCKGCSSQLTAAAEEDTTLCCDGGCGKRFKKDMARWCCSTCDFDLCEGCSLGAVTEEADLAAAAADEAIRNIEEAEAEAEAAAEEAAVAIRGGSQKGNPNFLFFFGAPENARGIRCGRRPTTNTVVPGQQVRRARVRPRRSALPRDRQLAACLCGQVAAPQQAVPCLRPESCSSCSSTSSPAW